MDFKEPVTRRQVCRTVLATAPTCAILASSIGSLVSAGKALADAPLKLVAETDPMAKALKYMHDGAKAKRDKRGDTEGKDQHCSNCQMYTKQGKVDGKEVGKCIMIQAGSVAAVGWCNSWSKKAKV